MKSYLTKISIIILNMGFMILKQRRSIKSNAPWKNYCSFAPKKKKTSPTKMQIIKHKFDISIALSLYFLN